MVELSFEALRKIQVQERTFGALSTLDGDFYSQYSGWVAQQKKTLQESFSIEALKTYENSKKVITEIGAKREQKILLKALKDLRGGLVGTEGLSSEEKTMYLQVISSLKAFERAMHAEEPAQLEEEVARMIREEVQRPKLEATRVILLQDLSQFVAPDGTTLGPFKANDVVEMHREIADILVKRNAAKLVGGEGATIKETNSGGQTGGFGGSGGSSQSGDSSGIIALPENPLNAEEVSAGGTSPNSGSSESEGKAMDDVEYVG